MKHTSSKMQLAALAAAFFLSIGCTTTVQTNKTSVGSEKRVTARNQANLTPGSVIDLTRDIRKGDSYDLCSSEKSETYISGLLDEILAQEDGTIKLNATMATESLTHFLDTKARITALSNLITVGGVNALLEAEYDLTQLLRSDAEIKPPIILAHCITYYLLRRAMSTINDAAVPNKIGSFARVTFSGNTCEQGDGTYFVLQDANVLEIVSKEVVLFAGFVDGNHLSLFVNATTHATIDLARKKIKFPDQNAVTFQIQLIDDVWTIMDQIIGEDCTVSVTVKT